MRPRVHWGLTFAVHRTYILAMMTLKDWMDQNGETDHTLAAKLSVSRVQVLRLRHRAYRPSLKTARELEAVTGIAASDFLTHEAFAPVVDTGPKRLGRPARAA